MPNELAEPILARLDAKAADAKDLVLKMYRENAEREDLSAFEIGGMFAQWLRNGLYKTQREISAATHLHETTVGQYVAIAELPAEMTNHSAIPNDWKTEVYWPLAG